MSVAGEACRNASPSISAAVAVEKPPHHGLHEDAVATLIGVAIVTLTLAGTWAARPASDADSRQIYPKGWPTPLAATIDKPRTWSDSPVEVLVDKRGRGLVPLIVLGMRWVVAVATAGHVERMEARAVNLAAMYYTELERLLLWPAWIERRLVLWP